MFPLATIWHLAHAHLDHCSILMELYGVGAVRFGERPFKFQAVWLLHADFYIMTMRE